MIAEHITFEFAVRFTTRFNIWALVGSVNSFRSFTFFTVFGFDNHFTKYPFIINGNYAKNFDYSNLYRIF